MDAALDAERIPMDPFPFLDNQEEMMQLQLVILGRDVSKRAPWKPEEDLEEDPLPQLPELDETPSPCWPLAKEYFEQPGFKSPRSSYYTFDLPDGLPDGESAAPNRILHDAGAATQVRRTGTGCFGWGESVKMYNYQF
eukprot:Skav225058  [mRNA]  locus=scaffold3690:79290:82407:+ [translate_table: standard]